MLILGGRVRSETGNVSVKAEGELSLLSTSDRFFSTSISSKNGVFKDKTTTKTVEDTTVNGVDISTGNNGGIALQSGGDMTLESVRLQSGAGGIVLSTPGEIHFDIAQETHYKNKNTQSDWVVWQKTEKSGKRDLIGVDNQLSSTGDISINAGQGVSLVYAQHRGENSQGAYDRVLNQNAWIAELESQGNLSALAQADTRKQWESSHSGLTPLGGVIVAALTAYYTGPMFNSLVSSSASSLSSLMQKSIATGLTASTTTAVVQFGTDGKIDGNLVFKAGLVAALGSALGNAKIWGENGNTSVNEMAGIDSTYTGTEARKAVMGLTFSQDQLLGIAGRGVINATLDSVINGTSFGDSILRGITNDFAALGAQSIGNAWGGNVLMNPSYNPDLQILAHMGLGGLAAGIRGDSIGSGALGGLLEGIIGNMVKEVNNQGLYTSGTMLASGLAAHLVGKDPVTAALAAQNAAENNRLLHESEKELAKRLAQESGGKYTVKQMEDALRWAATSTETMAVSPILLNSKTIASSIYDSGTLLLYNPRPGEADAMLYQDLTKIQQPSRDLVAYIEGKTGNTYSWSPGLWQSSPEQLINSVNSSPFSAGWNMGYSSAGLVAPGVNIDTRPQSQVDREGQYLVMGIAGLPAMIAAGLIAGPEVVATLGASKMAIGGSIGVGFDVIGQTTNPNNGDYRYGQTILSGVTGALSFPYYGQSKYIDAALGMVTAGMSTAVNNGVYGRNDSVVVSSLTGGLFSYGGYIVGDKITKIAGGLLPSVVYSSAFLRDVPILLQGTINPMPSYIGGAVSSTVSGVPTFAPGIVYVPQVKNEK